MGNLLDEGRADVGERNLRWTLLYVHCVSWNLTRREPTARRGPGVEIALDAGERLHTAGQTARHSFRCSLAAGIGRGSGNEESGNERPEQYTKDSSTCRRSGAEGHRRWRCPGTGTPGSGEVGSAEVSSLFRSSASLNEPGGVDWLPFRTSEGRSAQLDLRGCTSRLVA
jgi:hypothetical protein